MPRISLTDAFCRSARPLNGALTEYADAKERGLALRVTAQGVRSWTFRYRTLAGQQKRISLGRLDDISLADARSAVIVQRSKLHSGQDPVAVRRAEKDEALRASKLESVAEIGRRYFNDAGAGRHRPNARPKRRSTIDMERSYFEKHVVPRFGKEKLADLTRARIQGFVNDVVGVSPSAARQCRVVLHAIFNFAMWQEIVASNPCRFVTVPQFNARERVLSDGELKAVWVAFRSTSSLEDVHVSPSVATSVLLAAVSLQRRSEVTGMRKREIDRETKTWTIPGGRTKNHRMHVVPLSPLAIELIDGAMDNAEGSEFVFPSPRDRTKPIEPAALSHAFRRVAKFMQLKGIRPHDLRRTGATALTSEQLGFPRFIVSRVLNHASDTGGSATVTGVYDRNSYLAEKRKALDAWARLLLRVVGEAREEATVVTLRTA